MSEIMFYGDVGGMIESLPMIREIKDAKKGAKLHINSPGGSVWEGYAIARHLEDRPDISTHVDALCASIATVVFMASPNRSMARGSRLMIHDPWSIAMGTSRDLRKEADVLEGLEVDLAGMYSKATGGKVSVEEMRQLMAEETWFTPEQALALGLCHSIEGRASAYAKIPENLQFRNIPKGLIMEDQTTNPAPKAGLIDTILAKIGGGSEAMAAKESELATVRAEVAEAQAALVDAVAKVTAAQAEAQEARAALAAKDEEIKAVEAKHVEALAAARIEGAQEATAQMLKANAGEPLPHVEPEGETGTATEKWNALRAAGKYAEAGAHYAQHKTAILKGE